MSKEIKLKEISIHLLPSRAAYVPKYEVLVISDWLLNKLDDNQNGISSTDSNSDTECFYDLEQLLIAYSPQKMIFLGDIFLADWSSDWHKLNDFAAGYKEVEFILIQNDVMADRPQDITFVENISFVANYLVDDRLFFTHKEEPNLSQKYSYIVGELNPGCIISGKGRQMYRLPCFKLNSNVLTLPPFGKWTTLNILKKNKKNKLYAILGDHIVDI